MTSVHHQTLTSVPLTQLSFYDSFVLSPHSAQSHYLLCTINLNLCVQSQFQEILFWHLHTALKIDYEVVVFFCSDTTPISLLFFLVSYRNCAARTRLFDGLILTNHYLISNWMKKLSGDSICGSERDETDQLVNVFLSHVSV